ncbi:MAG: hypothetical protein ABT19_06010 [Rhodanobacter sp. SCN 68-63]|nr:MAG: hypothetical protein ABT19_06010 [Rhodanobacter sp. SCN 68-63]
MHLRQSAEAQAGHVAGHLGQRLEHRAVVEDLVVDLVAQQQQPVPRGNRHQLLEQRPRVHRAGGIVRVDQHQRAGARRDQGFDLGRVRLMAVLRQAAVIAWLAAVEDGGGAPAGQQHLVTRLQQRAQADVDQLTDAVADEDAFGIDTLRTACALLGGNGGTSLFQALLVAVGLAVAQVRGDCLAQVGGRFESVAGRVADVELDDRPTLGLELTRTAGQGAANFVAHVCQVRAGFDRGQRRDSFALLHQRLRPAVAAC